MFYYSIKKCLGERRRFNHGDIMDSARWIGFSFMYMAIFTFLLMITEQGTMPAITVSGLANQFVVTLVVSGGVAIAAALLLAIATEKGSMPFGAGISAGGSVAIASVKVAFYAAAVTFVSLWALWIGGLLVVMMPAGMPAWMSVLFIAPFLLPTVWAVAAEFLSHKT